MHKKVCVYYLLRLQSSSCGRGLIYRMSDLLLQCVHVVIWIVHVVI